MKRRKFLENMTALLGSVAALSFLYPLVRFISPLKFKKGPLKMVLSKSDIPVGGAVQVIFNEKPVVVINRVEKGLIAFSRVCTHFGCLVSYSREHGRLLCPCHAGEFNLDGKVLAGPPPRPLDRVPLTVEGDKVEIG